MNFSRGETGPGYRVANNFRSWRMEFDSQNPHCTSQPPLLNIACFCFIESYTCPLPIQGLDYISQPKGEPNYLCPRNLLLAQLLKSERQLLIPLV